MNFKSCLESFIHRDLTDIERKSFVHFPFLKTQHKLPFRIADHVVGYADQIPFVSHEGGGLVDLLDLGAGGPVALELEGDAGPRAADLEAEAAA